jgi:predicted esterase YcpF (UPF0227 family)
MYPSSIGPLRPPTKFNTLKEFRAPLEWFAAYGNRKKLKHTAKGDGRIIVLVPGYGAGKWSMRPLKKFLKSINYQVFDWGHGRNRGYIKDETALLADTIKFISKKHNNQTITVIGWSLGGVLSREVARLYPQIISEVITMGTPLVGGPKYTVAANKYAKSMDIDLDIYEAEIHEVNSLGIKQPVTVIYSKSDGVVGWRASLDSYNEQARNIEVNGSHLGLGVNVEVWKIIAETLSKPIGSHYAD